MPQSLRRAVWLLGGVQCALWGVIYYGFPVLLVPLERELGLTRPQVAGAFSLALFAMALVAPSVGRRVDRGRGPQAMRLGLGLALLGLGVQSIGGSAFGLYAAWLLLGLAMGHVLYEPAFGLVTRAIDDDAQRLRALSAVTVMGGLASTLFLPVLALAIEWGGWRAALAVSAVVVLVSAWALERGVFPPLRRDEVPVHTATEATQDTPSLAPLTLLFVTATLSGMALMTLLVPMLLDRGVSAPLAASVLACLGISQLPGRVWMLRTRGGLPRWLLIALPVVLQAGGLALVAAGAHLALAVTGVVLFGTGSGLHTLARPWLVQERYGRARAGAINGRVARAQGFARAAGPVVAAAGAALLDARVVLAVLGLALLALLPVARSLARAPA